MTAVTSQNLASRILGATTIDAKLEPPRYEPVDEPGEPLFWDRPARPAGLEFARHGPEMPALEGLDRPELAGRVLHILANHELQAVELFAFALLAYPGAPAAFRRGLARILIEEQVHTRLYIERLAAYGLAFGDLPVNGYFWSKSKHFATPAHFVSGVSLTFEGGNLDHSLELAGAFRAAGDLETTALLERVHEDEIGHVRFGLAWLERFAPGEDAWEAWNRHLVWPLRPSRARGRVYQAEARRRAGMDEALVERIRSAE